MNRNIIKHILFWLLFLILWSAHDLVYHRNFLSNLMTNSYTFLPYTFLVYFNIGFLVPALLFKKKIVSYILVISGCIALITFISSWGLYYFFIIVKSNLVKASFFVSSQGMITILTEILVLMGFSMTFFLLDEWHKKEKYTIEVERKRLEAELLQLKSQINPHFLFNSLNSIYIMLGRNINKGKKMFLQFSDILSHQLYETSKENVSLAKEIEYLKNYIKIEKIRHEGLSKVEYSFPEVTNGLYISPMLLLPLIENAFKHGQSNDGYWIDIQMKISSNNLLNFTVKNSVNEKNNTHYKNIKGIGLTNIKRRLELIYPKKYHLNIENRDAVFEVDLKLELHEGKVLSS